MTKPGLYAVLFCCLLAAIWAVSLYTLPPLSGELETPAQTQDFFAPCADIVNINTACAAELQNLSGIGATRAENIVQYREAHGAFTSIDALLEVDGIGRKTFEELKQYICV